MIFLNIKLCILFSDKSFYHTLSDRLLIPDSLDDLWFLDIGA